MGLNNHKRTTLTPTKSSKTGIHVLKLFFEYHNYRPDQFWELGRTFGGFYRTFYINFQQVSRSLYTIGYVNQPIILIVNEEFLQMTIDDGLSADKQIDIVGYNTIPMDVIIEQSYLLLSYVNYYKNGNEIVFESNNLDASVLAEPRNPPTEE